MMGWFLSSLKSKLLRRSARPALRAPKPKRNWSSSLEDLEGRRLLSLATRFIPPGHIPTTLASNMISGPDGNLWVGTLKGGKGVIVRIGLNRSIATFPVPNTRIVDSLTSGPDGNVWFEGEDGGPTPVIGKVTPAGRFTEYRVPTIKGLSFVNDVGIAIVSGPGGDVWFGYAAQKAPGQYQDVIGRVTPGGAIKQFVLPVSSSGYYMTLAAKPGGNVWFTTDGGNGKPVLGRITPTGAVKQFPLGKLSPASVANGPNGSILLEALNPQDQPGFFRVSPQGALTPYNIPAGQTQVFENYLGVFNGSMWFVGTPVANTSAPIDFGLITSSGAVKIYPQSSFIAGRGHEPLSAAVARDGNLYLFDATGAVYRLAPNKLPTMQGASAPRPPKPR
jgi:streptogramin lyase